MKLGKITSGVGWGVYRNAGRVLTSGRFYSDAIDAMTHDRKNNRISDNAICKTWRVNNTKTDF